MKGMCMEITNDGGGAPTEPHDGTQVTTGEQDAKNSKDT